jgi:hypothetical protein
MGEKSEKKDKKRKEPPIAGDVEMADPDVKVGPFELYSELATELIICTSRQRK